MAISQGKSTRSPSGARNVANRGKRKVQTVEKGNQN